MSFITFKIGCSSCFISCTLCFVVIS
uniref:Uncharacterized protein n=1 Tax=Arundo donax TaxID=35708 RepID=A0A0A9C7W1_ARUDO